MYCKNCGKKLGDTDKFCSACGARVTIEPEIEKPAPKQSRRSFHITGFNWDLEGFPTTDTSEAETKKDSIFNWASVMDEAKREKPEKDEIMTENDLFVKITSDSTYRSREEDTDFDWNLGTTTRIRKTRQLGDDLDKIFVPAAIAEAEEAAKAKSIAQAAKEAEPKSFLEELAARRAEVEARAEAKEEPAAPASAREAEAPKAETAAAAAAAAAATEVPNKRIDKFYTFNRKSEEFQALLDQEYERLRQRIKEESEAEELLAAKQEKLDKARERWARTAPQEPVLPPEEEGSHVTVKSVTPKQEAKVEPEEENIDELLAELPETPAEEPAPAIAEEVVEEIPAEEPAPAVAEEVIEETPAEEPAPAAVEEVIEEVIEEVPAEEPAPEVAEEVIEEVPAEEPAPEVTEEVIEEVPAEEPAPEVAEEVIEEAPAEEPAPEVAEEVIEEVPAEEPAPEVTEEVIEEVSAEEPAPEVTEEVIEEAPAEEPAPEVTEEVIEEAPAEEPAKEAIEKELAAEEAELDAAIEALKAEMAEEAAAETAPEVPAEEPIRAVAEEIAEEVPAGETIVEIPEEEPAAEPVEVIAEETAEEEQPPFDDKSEVRAAAAEQEEGKKSLHYTDIFADDDDDDDDTPVQGRGKLILLDIIIVILAICVVISGILVFAENSAIAQSIRGGLDKVISLFQGGDEEKPEEPPEEGGTPEVSIIQQAIQSQADRNKNITEILENTQLVFDASKDYGVSGLTDAGEFVDSQWYTDDSGKTVNLSEGLVGTTIEYFSSLVERMNNGDDAVLALIDENSSLYGQVSAISGDGSVEHAMSKLRIGELKGSDGKYYLLVMTTETTDGGEDEISTRVVSLTTIDNKAYVSGVTDIQ